MNRWDKELPNNNSTIAEEDIDGKIEALYSRKYALCEEIRNLERIKDDERADLERLKQRNLTTIFHTMTGKIYNMQDRERMEAYKAEDAYDDAVSRLQALDNELKRLKALARQLNADKPAQTVAVEKKAEPIPAQAPPAEEAPADVQAPPAGEAQPVMAVPPAMAEDIRVLNEQKETLHQAINKSNFACGLLNQLRDDLIETQIDVKNAQANWLLGKALDFSLNEHQKYILAGINNFKEFLDEIRSDPITAIMQAKINIKTTCLARLRNYLADGRITDETICNKIDDAINEIPEAQKQIQDYTAQMVNKANALGDEIMLRKGEPKAIISDKPAPPVPDVPKVEPDTGCC